MSDKILINKFIKLNFPIGRFREGKRFKRGIVVESIYLNGKDNAILMLSSDMDISILYAIMHTTIKSVFNMDTPECVSLIKSHLHLK